jgi:hypothetical protein
VGTDGSTYHAIPTVTARAAPVAKPSVHRQSLEVGAECVSSARSDLCGGRPAMVVSTAINGLTAGAETVEMVERNMDTAVKRGRAHPAGV